MGALFLQKGELGTVFALGFGSLPKRKEGCSSERMTFGQTARGIRFIKFPLTIDYVKNPETGKRMWQTVNACVFDTRRNRPFYEVAENLKEYDSVVFIGRMVDRFSVINGEESVYHELQISYLSRIGNPLDADPKPRIPPKPVVQETESDADDYDF